MNTAGVGCIFVPLLFCVQVHMRSSLICLSIALLSLSACTTTSDVSALDIKSPSQEMTGSISRFPSSQLPRPVPQEDVGGFGHRLPEPVMAAPQRQAYAPQPAIMNPAPQSEEPVATPAIMTVPEPQAAPLELAAPPKPNAAAIPFKTGKLYNPRFRDTHPISFGSVKPKSFAIHGVDISRWQGNIDWTKLRSQGANFAYIKSTDGGDHLDPMFHKNWNSAGKAGLKRGAYHFFYWCRSGADQAKWFIRNVPKSQNALPPVIDVEYNHTSSCKARPSKANVLKKMKSFMDALEAHYGQRPIIYTAPDFYDDNLRGQFTSHQFWLRSVAAHPSKTYPDRRWVFWQYSGTGLSHGVKGQIDLNVFNGNNADWNRWLAKTSG
jgi:lysozyme